MALVNEWRQQQHMINYQSESDRIRNALSNSAIPFHIQEALNKITLELQRMGAKLYNIIS